MRRLVVVLALFGALAALAAGCSPKAKGVLKANLPPVAGVFVKGPVDTVNHNVRLYWFGNDPDGYVVGFEIRLLDPAAPADSAWTPTPKMDSLFSVNTPTGYAAPVFEVRAIDDQGLRSAVARQSFEFKNQPPTVSFQAKLRTTDTTFASVTLFWNASDPDGDGTRMRYRIWLDGGEGNPDVVSGNRFTIPTEKFLQGGQLLAGYRQAFLQAVDDGGMASAVDSMRWYVRAPSTGGHFPHYGRLLIIDDIPTGFAQNYSADTLYANTAARLLGPGEYTVLQLQTGGTRTAVPFRSNEDVRQTFQLFDAVVWYIGGNTYPTYETTLANYQAGVGAYLEQGGNLYLDGMDLIDAHNARGPLSQDFMAQYLGTDFLFQYAISPSDSSAGFGNANPAFFVSRWGDTLQVQQLSATSTSTGGFRVFGIRNPDYALLNAMPGLQALGSAGHLPYPVPVAVSVPQASGGRAVLVSFPLRAASSLVPRYAVVPRFLASVFRDLGLAP